MHDKILQINLWIQLINKILKKAPMNPLSIVLLLLLTQTSISSNLTIVTPIKFYFSDPPLWQTSSYFRAGNKAVISQLTGSSLTPTFTFSFSSALTALPELAYGIKNYRGNDYLAQQFFEVKKTGLTSSTFTVAIQIYGITNLWLLNVAYLAVQPSFPHHFNTFDNVPLNSSGPLVNITTKSSALQYYTNYVNYTQQAIGKTHNQFTPPLSSNIIVLFMTSLWVRGTFKSTQFWPVRFHISSSVINTSHYLLNATLDMQSTITNVHFSQIIFNSDDIISSKRYYVIYGKWYNDANGGFIPIPFEFVDNFIMGITAFQAIKTECGFQYQWQFANNTNGTFGVQMQVSMNIIKTCGFNWSESALVYIQTWLCVSPFDYFNISSGMCQTNCGGYSRANLTSLTCEPCENTNCYQCDDPNTTICTDCNINLNYELINGSCECKLDYFETQSGCVSCDMVNPGCINCTYFQLNLALPFNISLYTCNDCNETINYFLTGTLCQPCLLSFCDQCINTTACLICQPGKSLTSIMTCADCFPTGCEVCQAGNLTICDQCLPGYQLDNTTFTCFIVCGDGFLITPQVCDDGNLVNGDGCSNTCLVQIHYRCTNSSPSICNPICGDGFILTLEACDDGNILNGDGCSSTCTVQANFVCTSIPSICSSTCGNGVVSGTEGCDDGNFIDGDGCNSYCQLQIILSLSSITKILNSCNKLSFELAFNHHIPYMDGLDFSTVILFYHSHLYNSRYTYSKGIITVQWDYSANMQNEIVNILLNATATFSEIEIISTSSLQNIVVLPNNNIGASYLDTQKCKMKNNIDTAYSVIEKLSYSLLILSALPGKIVGLQLFGVLQLAFLCLGSIDQVNVMMAPLMSMKGVNGLSIPLVHSSKSVPQRVKGIDYSANFLDNCNVMFILLFCELGVALILYAIANILQIACPKLFKFANRMLKQVFLTLILFNSFNIAYSAAIHFKYGQDIHLGSTLAAIISTGAIILMGLVFPFVHQDGFGEFKEKFGKDPVRRNYFTVTIAYRIGLGLVLGSGNQQDLSTLWAVGLSLLFVIYNLINLPFKKAYHNYRACLCHLTQFTTLFVAMFYRSMKSTVPPEQVAYIFSPAVLQLVLIIFCLAASLIVLAYDIYLFVKQIQCTNQQTPNPRKLSEQNTYPHQIMPNTDSDNYIAQEINNVTKDYFSQEAIQHY